MSLWAYGSNDRGNTAVSFSLAAVGLFVVAGGVIDYTNVVKQQVKMQSAADAAVLSSVDTSLANSARQAQAQTYFDQNIDTELKKIAAITAYTYNPGQHEAHIRVEADIPVTFLRLAGWANWPIAVVASATATPPANRVLDIAMCIDVTGSMQSTIDAAANSAMALEADINNQMRARNLPPFDAVRAIVHSYRDYGGNNPNYHPNHYTVAAGGYVDRMPNPGAVWMPPGDSANYGDQVPLQSSAYFNLPAQSSAMRTHLNSLFANGGGDYPESGLECVNAALNGAWLKKGDPMPNGAGTIGAVYPMIAVWSDIDAQAPSHPWALLNANYPDASTMPRDYAGLLAKWQDAGRIDQTNKLILTFVPSNNTPVWDNIRAWPGYFNGGTLQTGNTQAASRIADAMATLPSARTAALTE